MLGRLGRARLGQFLLSPEPGPQHSAKEKTESKTERMAEHRRSNKGQRGGGEGGVRFLEDWRKPNMNLCCATGSHGCVVALFLINIKRQL